MKSTRELTAIIERRMSGAEACRVLESQGFVTGRRRGRHVVMQRRISGTTITVPVPDHEERRLGTLASIIRQSGLARELFEADD